MDAVKFLKERKRLCQMYDVCGSCPANSISGGCIFRVTKGATPEEQSDFIKAWSTAHPLKTRQSVFLEQYPEADIDDDDVLWICPSMIARSHRRDGCGCANTPESCPDCRRKFWLQEIE